MGKRGKKQRHHDGHSRRRGFSFAPGEEMDDGGDFHCYQLSSPSAREEESSSSSSSEEEEEEKEEEQETRNDSSLIDIPSKFELYQQSVQSPKGDISYLQKFFLMYVGGRLPIHLQEDFCGTALLSAEWLRTDPRRTAVGLDLDLEALMWCMENNVNKVGADGYSRISLFHGNVLNPADAKLIKPEPTELIGNLTLEDSITDLEVSALDLECIAKGESAASFRDNQYLKRNITLPSRDIVCAFNYSCCCLHSRADLVMYFKHARGTLSRKRGIFVMDLYGGISSEQKLRLQRKFANFKYIWEQAEFDIIGRKTRISLHFELQKQQKKLRHAFSYSWRLWSLPEIKDCLEEAGFKSVHFWLRQMPDDKERSTKGFGSGHEVKYEEMETFQQKDSWNAYIIGVS